MIPRSSINNCGLGNRDLHVAEWLAAPKYSRTNASRHPSEYRVMHFGRLCNKTENGRDSAKLVSGLGCIYAEYALRPDAITFLRL